MEDLLQKVGSIKQVSEKMIKLGYFRLIINPNLRLNKIIVKTKQYLILTITYSNLEMKILRFMEVNIKIGAFQN